jgi:hypothetical protein
LLFYIKRPIINPYLLSALIAIGLVQHAHAQDKLFAVSGQGRGSEADARQAAQISSLESENAERETETSQNAADIADHETRITNNENELATIQPHAKQSQRACANGELIQWNGSVYSCVPEADPLLGEHGKASKPPPDCHDVNAKLLWNATTQQWHCVVDQQGVASESDPKVGATTSGQWCRGTGSTVTCDQAAPRNHAFILPPICSGTDKALQWNGSNWGCASVGGGGGGGCAPNTGTACGCGGTVACDGSCSGGFCGGCCFPGDTLVEMADGSFKRIDQVRLGEKVRGLYGYENEVLALQPVELGNRTLWEINGEVFTTADHPFWTGMGFGVLSMCEYLQNDYGRPQEVVVDDNGAKETWTYPGTDITKMTEIGLGDRIGFNEETRIIKTLKAHRAEPEMKLYSLVLGGSHTMRLAGGYVFSGWARDDDFDYQTGKPTGKPTIFSKVHYYGETHYEQIS